MSRRQSYAALFSLGLLTLCVTTAFGQEARDPAVELDPAAAFALLAKSVMQGNDAVEFELGDLLHPDLFEILTQSPNGKYTVKQLTLAKDHEVRALSVALHPPHDIFLIRGKEVDAGFEGMYYIVDGTGWLEGAAFREGKTITQVPTGDAWQAYEREKAFWIWRAGQIRSSAEGER